MLIACCLAIGAFVTTSARNVAVPKMYIFGFAASFNDSIVHFTDIQEVDSAWINSKNQFLLARESYTYQLRSYLADKLQMPHRTCIVIYNQERDKLEKEYQKMLRLYTTPKQQSQHFDVRMVKDDVFHFYAINMSDAPDEELLQAEAKKARKAEKQNKQKKDKKPKKPKKVDAPGKPEGQPDGRPDGPEP